MTDFKSQDLRGARFEDVSLIGVQVHDVDVSRSRFRLVDLSGAVVRDAALANVEITGRSRTYRSTG